MTSKLVQDLLNLEAKLGNEGKADSPQRQFILKEIKSLRGEHNPPCWGEDDCSTSVLVTCPWRIDCGSV